MHSTPGLALLALAGAVVVRAQEPGDKPPSTYPHVYPGEPKVPYGPVWQKYFQVTEPLPNVTWALARNWAGNMPVQRAGHPNDTLFFWAVEKENGSLTAAAGERSDEPWGIWLNGQVSRFFPSFTGPGSASTAGFMIENGPFKVQNDYSIYKNNYTFANLADYVWIDQPVGAGWATADAKGYVADEDQMGADFFKFLENLVKVFPSLATRPLHITGESYAGTYIPYIAKAYFGLRAPPVKLAGIAIGDGTLGSDVVFNIVPTLNIIETYPQLIGYDTDVYAYFKEQEHLCGYDLNLTYPQTGGHFPDLQFIGPSDPNGPGALKTRTGLSKRAFVDRVNEHLAKREARGEALVNRAEQGKRDLTSRKNGTINSWYGCDLYTELLEYAVNYTYPWNLQPKDTSAFDVYNIPDALFPAAPQDASVFFNNNQTRAAIHAPTSKDWAESIFYPFGNSYDYGDPSIEPMAFLSELATNLTKHNVSVTIYSGNDDSLVAHRGSEVVIQNTTFGGIQGFTRKPSTPWYDLEGTFAGTIHQERGWTYALVKGAGHLVPFYQPKAAYTLLRDFILGANTTGLVTSPSKPAVGGESASLAAAVLPGGAIYAGAGTTQSTYYAPTATVQAWDAYITTAAPPGDFPAAATPTGTSSASHKSKGSN
ncbi:hypothetical protein HWV62_22379 [Athelia sp. TMB]|nr:hypothetical protein HWV62_22379 [Athelia sp. TMB]